MKTILIFCVLLGIAFGVENYFSPREFTKTYWTIDDPAQMWDDFKVKFQKSYATPEEEVNKFKIFVDHLKRAKKLNDESPHTQFGVTQFMDMTLEQFKSEVLMTNTTSLDRMMSKLDNSKYQPINRTSPVPNSFDWRSRGVVTPVYNQGNCGSCWAFSATENIESQWAISGHGLPELSVQEIIDCCDESQMGCAGGSPAEVYNCVYASGGQDLLEYYPYIGVNGQCHFESAWIGAKVSGWRYASTTHNEEQMLDFLLSVGPISICVDAEPWVYYNGGVFTPSQCGLSVDHCVLITGYDLANNPPYWVVRNSWGTGWGYAGYIALEYGTNTCNLTSFPTCAVP